MILLALAAITYGCYQIHHGLGWAAGGLFLFMGCVGKHKIAEERKRQQRIDATMDRITKEVLRLHATHEEQQHRIVQEIQDRAWLPRRVH